MESVIPTMLGNAPGQTLSTWGHAAKLGTALGMNYGVRYSYDAGKCTGSNTLNLGPCSETWDRFGYVPGCNNFKDKYPWPAVDTAYPEGIWYDLPLEGKCKNPTGAWNCTWSAEDAGEIRLEELEAKVQG